MRRALWITAALSSRNLTRHQIHYVYTSALSGQRDMETCKGLSSTPESYFSNNLNSILDRLRRNVNELLILDGGTGEEIFRRGVPGDRKIWSATAVVHKEHHQTLKDVHRSFIDAGSNAITTNSYGITPGVGFSRDDIRKFVELAGKLARESLRDEDDAIVFGSLGPLVESYRPDLVSEHSEGVEYYKLMANALAPNIDCFLAETMSSVEESTQAIEAVGSIHSKLKVPMMVSYTLNSSGKIRSGEAVTDAIPEVLTFSREAGVDLIGVMFNCAEPEAITMAFQEIKSNSDVQLLLKRNDVHLGAYANKLTPIPDQWSLEESEEAQEMRDDLSPSIYFNKFVNKWVKDLNVRMVGGCCGITPEHIAYMKSHFSKSM
mmetsp:Transcript_6310/g.9168  ORF Transcript_6310/g.9168 Transcript_6310/m.9168 type:complete len:376 (-) Transcript_6310:317-1444(-)